MYIYIIYRSYRYFFFHPIYYPRTTIAIPPSNTSYPGSQGGPSSPLPTSQLQSDWSLSCDHGLDYARTTTTTTTTSVRSFFLSREEFNIFFPRRLASRCTGVCRLHIKPSFLPNYIPQRHQYNQRPCCFFILQRYHGTIYVVDCCETEQTKPVAINQGKASEELGYRAREHNKTSQTIK